jgi:hypothetical protein
MTTYDDGTDGSGFDILGLYVSKKIVLRIIYIIGVAFFSGLLVMILTNAIRNIINRIESGDVRYHFKNHVLIFGYH